MNRVVAGFFVALVVAFLSMGAMPLAQAYPDVPPTTGSPTVTSQPPAVAGPTASTSNSLPATGGPNELLLVGAAGLIVVGGASVLVARRRQNH